MNTHLTIAPFDGTFAADIGLFINAIQRNEFGVPITLEQQPDLANIAAVYQQKNGNFWVASNGDTLAGTIALVDAGDGLGIIRKMFVAKNYRGAPHRVGQHLLNELEHWAEEKGFTQLYLGTVDMLKAAHRFYEKNGFTRIDEATLPPAIDAIKMPIDTVYYTRKLAAHAHAA